MKKFISLNGLLSFLLFFAVSFIAIFYQCANAEYNLKEQIDRGYISRNAVFFTFDNPAEITEEEYTVVIDSDTNSILVMSSSYSFDLGKFGNMNIAEYDMDGNLILPEESADLAADNSPDANGQTLIMNLLSGGKGSYFAAVHAGTGRYVYYQGDPELPPMADGGCLCIVDLTEEDGSFHRLEKDFQGHNGFDRIAMGDLLDRLGYKNIESRVFFEGTKPVEDRDVPYSLFILTANK